MNDFGRSAVYEVPTAQSTTLAAELTHDMTAVGGVRSVHLHGGMWRIGHTAILLGWCGHFCRGGDTARKAQLWGITNIVILKLVNLFDQVEFSTSVSSCPRLQASLQPVLLSLLRVHAGR
jgi:hypothetical protein